MVKTKTFKVVRQPKNKIHKIYKVVRTYNYEGRIRNFATELEKAFKDGWEFVRASEFVTTHTYSEYISGYIEYILSKDEELL